MIKYIIIYLFLSLFVFDNLKGQNFVKGEVLVQLSDKTNLKAFENSLAQAKVDLRLKSEIFPEQQIYLYTFDYTKFSHEEILKKLNQIPQCLKAQHNHYLQNRTIPNDPLYPNQWQYNNIGNNGGSFNADIDADLAWNISTGGTTAFGDTIVVCIIDDGIDTLHEDLRANLWKNIHEIPNNGIDDDGNGYIDDIRGWNTLHQDNNISGGGHGTPVAAIVGAVGNNNIGVSGVNWNVKLMIVKGGGTEAQALLAYAYPWKMRKLYNETAGQLGAFVVATNASWGIDNLQAADAPIWCDFYDILGSEGILNIASTSNRNVNVDIVGDMPTTCTSPYLLTVTNIMKNDNKESNAAYGAQSIDLGAYGSSVYTALNNNTYGTFGGTSAAAPHVTGVAALIYALPCLGLAYDAQMNPANTALAVKDFILQGGSNNTSLQNITTTGKRLNAHGALLAAQAYNCSLPNCHSPFQIQTSFNTDNSFAIQWASISNSQGYSIKIGLDSAQVQTYTTNDTFIIIPNIEPCQTYFFQVSNTCSLDGLDYESQYFYINSGNCCYAPNALNNILIDENNIHFNWSNTNDASNYVVFWKREFGILFDSLVLTDTFIHLPDLEPCTNYEIQIKSNCPINNMTNLSQIFRLRTSGCGTCIDENYCAMKGASNNYEWISNVSINNFSHTSGKSNGGYSNEGLFLNAPIIDLRYPVTFSLSLEEHLSSANWQWSIWIDLNKDGIFDNTTELVYNTIATTSTINGNLNIPRLGILGNTRMRIAMRWGSTNMSSCEDFPYGEVEDYCIIIDDINATHNLLATDLGINIYPNPFSENIHIFLERAIENEKINLYLHDILGREIYFQALDSGNNQFEIQTSHIAKGSYILSLRTEKGIILSRKLVK